MRKSLFLILIALIFAVGGCSQFAQVNPCDPGSTDFDPSSVTGRVISKITRVLIEDATVEITSLATGELLPDSISIQSDDEGQYFSKIATCKEYTLRIKKEGYSKESREINTNPGGVFEEDFEIEDIGSPIIIYFPTTISTQLNTEVEISASITDNEGVSKTKLYYKTFGAGSITESDMVKIDEDRYEGTIPSDIVVIAGVEYYIQAEDASSNSARSDTYRIKVIEGAILSLNPKVVSIPVGGIATVASTALKADGSPDIVSADSNNEFVAKVSESGNAITITGVAKGVTTVVVTSGSGLTETVIVTVTKLGEASLTLDKTAVSIVVDNSAFVSAIATKEDGSLDNISVLSLNTDVAQASTVAFTISITIKIDGVGIGNTTVLVTSGSGKTATIKVTVIGEGKPTLILDPSSLNIPVGSDRIIDVTATKADGLEDTVTATSNEVSIATVSSSGSTLTVSGVAIGTTTIIVESESELIESVAVNVYQPGIASLSLDKTSLTVEVGKTGLVNVTALKADGTADTVTDNINPGGIATVAVSADSKNITIAGVAVGSATLTVTSDSGPSKTVSVTVYEGETLTLDKTSLTVESGKTDLIDVTAIKADGTTDTFTATINPGGIATVTPNLASENISVNGVSIGSATVTATSGSGLSETASVTVTPGVTSPTNSTVEASPISVETDGMSTSSVTVTLKDANNNLISGHSVTISSGSHPTTITPSLVITDTSGQALFSVKSSQGGIAIISATDTTEVVSLTSSASITFLSSWAQTTYDDFNSGATTGIYLTQFPDDVILDSDPATSGFGNKVDLGIGNNSSDFACCPPFLYRLPDGTFRLYYSHWDIDHWKLAYETSSDGVNWSGRMDLGIGSSISDQAYTPFLYQLPDGTFRLYYGYYTNSYWRLSYRTSPDGVTNWSTRMDLGIGSGSNDQTYEPFLYQLPDGTFRLYYAHSTGSYWQLSYRTSNDGVTNWSSQMDLGIGSGTFDQANAPFIYKLINGTFRLYYYYWNNYPQLSYRTSADGVSGWSGKTDLGIGSATTDQASSPFIYKLTDGTFRLYYHFSDGSNDRQISYRTVPGVFLSSGNLESSAFDTGAPSTFTTLTWNATTPASTSVKFQIRSASTQVGLSSATWYGPTGSGDFYTTSGTAINGIHNGGRWVQYRVTLDTSDTSKTPTLHDLRIDYY